MSTMFDISIVDLSGRYRSGHNEAVLKTVCPKRHVGSNPTLPAIVTYVKANLISFNLCRCRTTVSIEASQASDGGSTPLICSIN